MHGFVNIVTGLFDQLNPFNTGNIILYFSWLVVFTFTMIAVWRSDRRWIRFLCFWVNQLFSVGFILSWTLTSLLAYTFWQHSIGVIAATAAISVVLFRRRVDEEAAV